jgi:hypothetical protein
MYDTRFNLIIGFHGCDRSEAQKMVNEPNSFKISDEKYDWLGHGMYFWENNLARAWQWAKERQARKGQSGADAAVVGAVIQLGYCCDLVDSRFTAVLKSYFQAMEKAYKEAGKPLPANQDASKDPHKNKLIRLRDCAAIEYMHARIDERIRADVSKTGFTELKKFDSTRGVFVEGGPIYDGAEIFEKSHIQICIRNSNCIKGFFFPRNEVEF